MPLLTELLEIQAANATTISHLRCWSPYSQPSASLSQVQRQATANGDSRADAW